METTNRQQINNNNNNNNNNTNILQNDNNNNDDNNNNNNNNNKQASSANTKHVRFAPVVDFAALKDDEKNAQNVENDEKNNKNGIVINVIEFCPEDIQNNTFKRLFVNVYKFSDLITELNKYLTTNTDYSVKNIETFLFVPNFEIGKVEFNLSNNFERFAAKHGNEITNCRQLFGIRVWLIKNTVPVKGQVIDVYHYVPKKRITGYSHATFFVQNDQKRIPLMSNLQSTLQELEFENRDEILAEINADLIRRPDYGNIVNVETVKMPVRMNEYSVDVQNIEWPQEIRGFVFILRVYVSKVTIDDNEAPCQQVQIEIHDFIPNMQTWDSPLAIPDFESFTSVLKRAANYLRERKDYYKLLNCSTISCPTPELSFPKIETYKNAFIDHKRTYYPSKANDYITKFVRLIITKPLEHIPNCDSSMSIFSKPDYHLNCKIFVPQSLPGTCQRLQVPFNEWFSKKDLTLISAETETVNSPHVWTSSTSLVDTCLTLASPTITTNRKMFFKFYVNGSIKELPPPMNKNTNVV